MLRRGESYRIPNRPGLTLFVGSAGALDVLLDGTPLPSLGPLGRARRNVPLDPERLRRAAAEPPSASGASAAGAR
ncbi:MAG: DUF4115 domain-containing protein [Alphaproteobacteria bacterium]